MPSIAEVLNRIAAVVRDVDDEERRAFAEDLAKSLGLPVRRVERALSETGSRFLTPRQAQCWREIQDETGLAPGDRLENDAPLDAVVWPQLLHASDATGTRFALDLAYDPERIRDARPIDWLEPGVHDVVVQILLFQTELEARSYHEGWLAADLATGGGYATRVGDAHAAILWHASPANVIIWQDARRGGQRPRTLAIVGPYGHLMDEEQLALHLDTIANA